MGRRFWDRIARVYDLAERTNKKANTEAVQKAAALTPRGARVLDCAAGTGEFSLALAPRAGTVLCTDLSRSMLDRAAAKAEKRGLSNLTFAVRDLTALPDPDGAFDVAVAANVLHLLPEPEKAVAELWRVTAPGGKLILPTYLQGEAGPGFRLLIALYKLLGFRPRYFFTLDSYAEFFRHCGLTAQVTRVDGCLPVGFAVLSKPLEE